MSAQSLGTQPVNSNRTAQPFRNSAATPKSQASGALVTALAMMGAPMSFARNVEVFGEGEAAEYLYQVRTGCIRTYKVLNDGRRQVSAFYLPGDVFGIEAGDEHKVSAEAIVPSMVTVVKRSLLNSRASGDSTLARQLFDLSVSEL